MRRLAVLASSAAIAACGPSVKKVTVDPPSATLDAKGASVKLKAIARDQKDRVITEGVKVAWTSSAPLVASVDEGGKVTALKSGEAAITASVGEVKGGARVFVAIPASVAVVPSAVELKPGESATLEVRVADDSGKPIAAPRGVVWSSSNAAVARVANGAVTAVGGGRATVTASAGALRGEAAVTVKAPVFARLAAKPARLALARAGASAKVTATALDKKGKPVAGVPVAWKSSNERVARVAADGTITAVKKGKAKVTASAGGRTAAVDVTVRR